MTCHSILAILSTDDVEAEAVLSNAVELAEQEHARLTLAALTGETRTMRWLAALALTASGYGPGLEDLATFAQRRVARAAEFIPTGVSVTTIVVTDPRQFLRSGNYDLMVVGAKRVTRRGFKRLRIPALVIPTTGGSCRDRPTAEPAPLPMPSASR
jgi:hypothetical protein